LNESSTNARHERRRHQVQLGFNPPDEDSTVGTVVKQFRSRPDATEERREDRTDRLGFTPPTDFANPSAHGFVDTRAFKPVRSANISGA
jgi:hypothetical protein